MIYNLIFVSTKMRH